MPGHLQIPGHFIGRQSSLVTPFCPFAPLLDLPLLLIYSGHLTQSCFSATSEYLKLSGLWMLLLAIGPSAPPVLQVAFIFATPARTAWTFGFRIWRVKAIGEVPNKQYPLSIQ